MTDEKNDPIIKCPKCGIDMRKLDAGSCMVDRCENCFGIWLDAGERHKLVQDKKQIKAIDIGSAEVGRKQNEVTDILCPRCHESMIHMRHPAQQHVEFEVCTKCRGSFFDAGELEDLSDFTVFERIKAMLGIR